MAHRTEGQRRLDAWFEADETRTRASLADKIGVSPQAISMWLSEANPSVPKEAYWALIEAITGIPGRAFLPEAARKEHDEREARLAALRGERPSATEG